MAADLLGRLTGAMKTFDELFAELTDRQSARPEGSATVEALDAGLHAQGIEPKSSHPAEFAAFIQDQLELHRKLAKQMHLDMTQ